MKNVRSCSPCDIRLYLHIAAVLGMRYRVVNKSHDVALCDKLAEFKKSLHRFEIFNIDQKFYDLQIIFLDVFFRFRLGSVKENLYYIYIL